MVEENLELVKHVLKGGRLNPAEPDAPGWIKTTKSAYNGLRIAWAFLSVFGFFLGVSVLGVALLVTLVQALTK
jgi:hypothetical protein